MTYKPSARQVHGLIPHSPMNNQRSFIHKPSLIPRTLTIGQGPQPSTNIIHTSIQSARKSPYQLPFGNKIFNQQHKRGYLPSVNKVQWTVPLGARTAVGTAQLSGGRIMKGAPHVIPINMVNQRIQPGRRPIGPPQAPGIRGMPLYGLQGSINGALSIQGGRPRYGTPGQITSAHLPRGGIPQYRAPGPINGAHLAGGMPQYGMAGQLNGAHPAGGMPQYGMAGPPFKGTRHGPNNIPPPQQMHQNRFPMHQAFPPPPPPPRRNTIMGSLKRMFGSLFRG